MGERTITWGTEVVSVVGVAEGPQPLIDTNEHELGEGKTAARMARIFTEGRKGHEELTDTKDSTTDGHGFLQKATK